MAGWLAVFAEFEREILQERGRAGLAHARQNVSAHRRETKIRLEVVVAVLWRPLRVLVSFAGVAIITFAGYRIVPVNATTMGFAYLLLVLVIASTWGFVEAGLASVLATLAFNFYFLPPIGTFTIADPQNWVALFAFLATSLITSRLSAKAKRRALEAIARRQDLERLYAFSRAILLLDCNDLFPNRLLGKLTETFALSAAALYDQRNGRFYREGSSNLEALDEPLRHAALRGMSFSDPQKNCIIAAVRLGSEPIASLALRGSAMPESVLQGVANLVAIGLERARAQDLAREVEAARQSEQLRTTLIDAMAHEFKTPLTLIKATTTALLASPEGPAESRREQLTIADEEADRLRALIDDAVEMARLDTARIEVHLEPGNAREIVREVVTAMQGELDGRPLQVLCDEPLPVFALDKRLLKLAIKQLVDNALKYSPPGRPVIIRIKGEDRLTIEITDHGGGIPPQEQMRIFERFYRSPAIKSQIPGSGLGLSIANRILQAHNGTLSVISHPGETTFRMVFPRDTTGDKN
jgi:two-component system sensor histidine kinase KdpD